MTDRRPGRDVLSFGAGLLFLAVALTVLLGGGHQLTRSADWLAPAVLLLLGVLGIASDRRRGRDR